MSQRTYFVNRSSRTPAEICELYRSYFFGRASAIVFHAVVLLYLAAAMGLFLYYLLALWTVNIPLLVFTILAALLLVYRIIIFKRYVKISSNELEGQGELCVTVEGAWLFTDEERKHGVPLSSIRRAYLTKNLIYLTFGGNKMVILSKAGFTEGSLDEFLAYLKEKSIPVSGKYASAK